MAKLELDWNYDNLDKNVKIVNEIVVGEIDKMRVADFRLFLADLIGMKRNKIMSSKECSSKLGKEVYEMLDSDAHSGASWSASVIGIIGAVLDYLNADLSKAIKDAKVVIR